MTEATQRQAVIAEAKSWLKTRYMPCADVKGAGVDCGMLLVRVFIDTGLCEPFEPRPYSKDWHLHRSEEKYLGFITRFMHEVEPERVDLGDIVVFKIGRCYAHGGIVTMTEPLTFIHAYSTLKCVSETELRHCAGLNNPRHRPRFFSYWAK
jgi:NlpC/P60 family putative phage cell wall peptidase